MTAFLPKNDPNKCTRGIQLRLARRRYEYNYTHVSPLAMAERVPINDLFSFEWIKLVGERVINVIANRLEILGDHAEAEKHRARQSELRDALRLGAVAVKGVRKIVEEIVEALLDVEFLSARPTSLDDFAELFRTIDLPPIHRDFQDDLVFAEMRIAGPNPVMLTRIETVPDYFPVTEAMYSGVIAGDSLEAAGQEGRLFLADYQVVQDVECSDFPEGQKYLYAPLSLYAVDPQTKQLRPIAIQCRQTPGPDNPIFTPNDTHNWLIAKTIVEIADGNIHEARTHLARTHLYMEPFCVSTHRQLARRHPLFQLLAPHFEGTLAINSAAWRFLIADGGPVAKLMSPEIQSTRALAATAVESYLFNEQFLPLALKSRGVDDADALPNYPYRDDSLLYWNAIHRWVSDYTEVFYHSDADVMGDKELAAWAREIGNRNGGRVPGIGQDGSVPNRDYLNDVLTMVIFTCSVQHAAVNFPQFDLMSYTPNMPLAGYARAPVATAGGSEQGYLNQLPPMDMAQLQLDLGYLLGSVHYTQLGHYQEDGLDERTNNAQEAFRNRLQDIGHIIQERNQTRRPYQFLEPAGIPQSINI